MCLPKDINVEELEFSKTSLEGLEVSPIKGNPFSEASLFAAKFAPGARNPLHVHSYQYEAAIWKGQFKHYIPDVDENDRNVLQNMSQTTKEYINSQSWKNATDVRFVHETLTYS